MRADRLEAFDAVLAAVPPTSTASTLEAEHGARWPGMDSRRDHPRRCSSAPRRAWDGRSSASRAAGPATPATSPTTIPMTVDGLGPRGGGAHTPEEFVLEPRCAAGARWRSRWRAEVLTLSRQELARSPPVSRDAHLPSLMRMTASTNPTPRPRTTRRGQTRRGRRAAGGDGRADVADRGRSTRSTRNSLDSDGICPAQHRPPVGHLHRAVPPRELAHLIGNTIPFVFMGLIIALAGRAASGAGDR